MEIIQLIVECSQDYYKDSFINSLGTIKYSLPMINSYVIEIPRAEAGKLEGMEGIKSVHQNAHITAQMNVARKAVNADAAIKEGLSGHGVTIAVLDTGISPVGDFVKPRNRIIQFKDFVKHRTEPYDDNAHGTHVAGIAAGNGFLSGGQYCGIAPEADICAIKILDEEGKGNTADVLAGLQWVIDNHKQFNIRVVNLSIGTADIGNRDPLVRAVEAAWDLGIVMTIAAGNNGPKASTVTSPGISCKVITVGASDDNRKVAIQGSSLINFSGRGPTSECIVKPDVIAPGTNIVSCLTKSELSDKRLGQLKRIDENYIRMSGTSMSTPIITGAVALLLEKYPNLSPDDIKYRIKECSVSMNYPQNQQGWGLVDIDKFIHKEVTYVRK